MAKTLRDLLEEKHLSFDKIKTERKTYFINELMITWLKSQVITNETHQIHIDYSAINSLVKESEKRNLVPHVSLGIEDNIAGSGHKFYLIPVSNLLDFAVPNNVDNPERVIIHLSKTRNHTSKQEMLDMHLIQELISDAHEVLTLDKSYVDTDTYSQIKNRRGQPQFRSELIDRYSGRCAISGCKTIGALEAAHVIPYSETSSLSPEQGLLLRADIHTLFDLYLISINPNTHKVEISSTCCDYYKNYVGKNVEKLPTVDAISEHYRRFVERNG